MSNCRNLSILRFSIAIGFTYGLGMLFLGLMGTYCGWGANVVEAMGTVYIGYQTTIMGSIIGGLWGLVDGFIGGALIAIMYNLLGRYLD